MMEPIEIQWVKVFFRPKTLVYRRKTQNNRFVGFYLGNPGEMRAGPETVVK